LWVGYKYRSHTPIDINKDYYRAEIVIKDSKIFDVSNHIFYSSPLHDDISEYVYDNAINYIKEVESQDPDNILNFGYNYEKYVESKNIQKFYTEKKTKVNKLDIEIDKLLYNKDYLYTLFYHFADKIILNIDKLLSVNYQKIKIKTKNKMRKKRTVNQKEQEETLRVKMLNYLHSDKTLSDEDYNKFMNKIENETGNKFGYIKEDIII
jgi:hypothetical protein